MGGQPSRQQQESALQALTVAVAALYAFLQANLTGCAMQTGRPKLVPLAATLSSTIPSRLPPSRGRRRRRLMPTRYCFRRCQA